MRNVFRKKHLRALAERIESGEFDSLWLMAWIDAGTEIAAKGYPTVRQARATARDVSITVALARSDSQQDAAALAGVSPPTMTARIKALGLVLR